MAKSDYQKGDFFSKKAKKEGYFARSIFKLKEIDEKYRIIKKKNRVLDLGAFPGSWSQYALSQVGPMGIVVGIDVIKIDKNLGKNYFFFNNSIYDDLDLSQYTPFHVIISDMAPKTSGIKDSDVYESLELSKKAVEIATKYLKREGVFICKVFQGEDFDEFYKEFRSIFKKVKSYKPKATRSRSKEIYIIGWGIKSL